MNAQEIAAYIDHTHLKPDADKETILNLCDEAKEYGFASVCVNPYWVSMVARELENSPVRTCVVIGFPLGANTGPIKILEAKDAIASGADELDMVINLGALKSGDWKSVEYDIRGVVDSADGKLVKVILETCLLSESEIIEACNVAKTAGADFVKTSTGFSSGGATVKDVKLMRNTVGVDLGVKASGGIRSLRDALNMIEAGASRIGASAGVEIIKGLRSQSDY